MKWTKLVIVLGLLALPGGLMSAAVAEPPAKDARCDGLTGAAFGLCTAAVNVGCDNDESRSPGCAKIEEKYQQITGEVPPWTIPSCFDNSECGDGEFCEKADGDCLGTGVCTTFPEACIQAYFPAIGCDSTEYDNYCIADAYGVNVLCYEPPFDPGHTEPVCP